MQSFLGVTLHYKNEDFELINLVLATKEVNDVHTYLHIVEWLEAVIEDYEMSPQQIVAIVTDNGANVVNACRKLKEKYGWIHIRCAAHTLQLCLKQAFDIPLIKSAIGAARHLVAFFRQSSKASQALKAAQEKEHQLELILDVSTRWNSTYSMLERLCRLQAYVRQVLCNGLIVKATSSAHLELKDNHWALIQTLVEKLKPITIATYYLEGEKYVSISGVIPLVKGLSQKYMPCEDSRSLALFKNKILTQLHERFGFVFNQNSCYIHMSIATWLDPRYKTSYFKKVDGIQIKGSIESEMIAINDRQMQTARISITVLKNNLILPKSQNH
ncbi:E3 SUMO-protein ligase ZBED1-like [Styela clava]